jgi:hypothetical protein
MSRVRTLMEPHDIHYTPKLFPKEKRKNRKKRKKKAYAESSLHVLSRLLGKLFLTYISLNWQKEFSKTRRAWP